MKQFLVGIKHILQHLIVVTVSIFFILTLENCQIKTVESWGWGIVFYLLVHYSLCLVIYNSVVSDYHYVLGVDPPCSVCLPLRAACFNMFIGWLMPTTLAFLVSTNTARLLYTHPVPPLNEFRALAKVRIFSVLSVLTRVFV